MNSFDRCCDRPKHYVPVIFESLGHNVIHFICENKIFSKMLKFFTSEVFRVMSL